MLYYCTVACSKIANYPIIFCHRRHLIELGKSLLSTGIEVPDLICS